MRRYLLLAMGVLAAPFANHKASAAEKKIHRAVRLVKKATGGKTIIEIKPLNKILLAPQDVSDHGGTKGKGGKKLA